MIADEMTVFDIKYNEGFERLNNLLSDNFFPNSIKNYVERYKLDKSRENRIAKKNHNTNNSNSILRDDKRKQIVDLYEIRDHDKKVQQLLNKNYLKNEIEWFKIKKREDENKNKYNYNKSKFENDSSLTRQDYNNEIIRTNNIKMKKFSNLANKVNIDKFIQIKKLNQKNNSNSKQKNNEEISNKNNNINNEGIFIPYSEYLQFEKDYNINSARKINNKKMANFNIKKTDKLNLKLNNTNSIKNIYQNIIKNNYSENNQNIKRNKNIKNNNINNHNNNINYKKNKIYNNINNNNKTENTNKKRNNISQNQEDKNRNNKTKKLPINNDIRYKIDIRKPLEKRIDYLRERKTSQGQRGKRYDSKKIFKDRNELLNNIDLLNFHSKNYEDKAKRQEQLMRVKGNQKFGNEDNIKLSNLLIDSISTKLAILEKISPEN